MPNDGYSQQALAADSRFQARVRSSLASVAWQVLQEDPATAYHTERSKYALTVLQNLTGQATSVSGWVVERPNVINFETSYSFAADAVVTAATDADLESQLMTDWNFMSGIITSPTAP